MTNEQQQIAEPQVTRWAFRFAVRGAKCGLGVDDLKQAAWLAVLEAAESWQRQCSWRTFVSLVISRRLQDATKHDLKEVSFDDEVADITEIEDPNGIEHKVWRSRLANQLIADLPQRERSVVSQYFGFQGDAKRLPAIARRLKISTPTASRALASALRILATKLAESRLTKEEILS